ncbi:imelysin family protein [Flagellimonas sp. S174]|uniref:imelysin family protein n=1 Tax=Flagellimonas sp. S174 TaxID=3410790 RepID=UPI003BF5789D
MKRSIYWILPVFMALLIWACSSDGDDTENPTDDMGVTDDDGVSDDDGASVTFDRGEMLTNWADNIILPSYNSFLGIFDALESDFERFQGDINEDNLRRLRATWIDAYRSWQFISMFEIGPAEDNGLRLNINTYPTDFDLIETHIETGTYNLDLPSNRDTKGFPALDYLLNGVAATDAEIVAIFADADTGNAYMTYLQDVLNDIQTRVTAVRDAWQDGYRDTFVTNDGSSATASVDRYVNDFIFYYEKFLRAGKMGIPLGVFTGNQAPNTIESFFYPELSNQLFQDGLNAVQDFFNGVEFGTENTGESLASYLVALGEESLRDDILNQFESARTAVGTLQPFRTEIETNNPATDMFAAYDEVQRAVSLLKVDMVSAMSIAIDFVDADGD